MAKFKVKVNPRLTKRRTRKTGFPSKRHCRFSVNKELADSIDYKNIPLLKGFLTERGKLLPSRVSGNSAYYQRLLAREIKKARTMGLLPHCMVH